jgi:two-component system OmpR family sensor kinase/two-component system sensor histidine kinase QseC
VNGDAAALRTLLRNLVDNALRHAGPAPDVHVAVGIGVGSALGRPTLTVDDHGPGLPAAERERVFARFYRRDGQSVSGSGLGLAIVRTVAERHGATVALADAPGGGLRVQVVFPASASMAPAESFEPAASLSPHPGLME